MRHGDRGTFNNVARLWSVVLLANLVGVCVCPWLRHLPTESS